jgi:hypothetical protein
MNKRPLSFMLILVLPACFDECDEAREVDPQPRVTFVHPDVGAVVLEDFEVEIELEHFVHDRTVDGTVELYINRDCPQPGEPTRDALPRAQFIDGNPKLAMRLPAGPHTLCVGLSDRSGLALVSRDLTRIEAVTSTAGPKVRIAYPADGATMVNGERMRFEVEGYVIRPRVTISRGDERFLFVVIDEPCLRAGTDVDDARTATRLEAGQLEHVVYLAPGRHTLCAGVADVEGRVGGPNASITIDVRY